MKSKLLALALGLSVSFSAFAGPVESLPGGPLFVKFTGAEQIAVGGANTGYANEISWGVFTVDTMRKGVVVDPNTQISPSGTAFFSDGAFGAQVTGIFYGIEDAGNPTAGNPLPGAKGYMDLYWRDLSVYAYSDVGTLSLSGPGAGRTDQSHYTGFTEGTLLARIVFTAGIDPSDPNVTVSGSVLPTVDGAKFTGQSDFFANVIAGSGAWANQLDTDYFTTAFGMADLKFKNSYNQLTQWNGGPGVLGAKIDDPAQAMALPEPGALSLMGLALIGMGAIRRRKQK
jgi:hypothetical protein